jgi:hypothetical protein
MTTTSEYFELMQQKIMQDEVHAKSLTFFFTCVKGNRFAERFYFDLSKWGVQPRPFKWQVAVYNSLRIKKGESHGKEKSGS